MLKYFPPFVSAVTVVHVWSRIMTYGESEDCHEYTSGRILSQQKGRLQIIVAPCRVVQNCERPLGRIFLYNLPYVGLKFLSVLVFISVFRLAAWHPTSYRNQSRRRATLSLHSQYSKKIPTAVAAINHYKFSLQRLNITKSHLSPLPHGPSQITPALLNVSVCHVANYDAIIS